MASNLMMNFDDWMRSTSLSEASVQKYYGAINGALSDWAFEAGISQGSLLNITSRTVFDSLVFEIQKLPVFQERNDSGHNMYSSALKKFSEFLAADDTSSIENDINAILSDTKIDLTEQLRLVSTRMGQGQYRKELLQYWGQCAISGYTDPSMLVASHIKPWFCSSNAERLDKYNGLLLTPNLDKAFDQGYISFDKSGTIMISPLFSNAEQLGITESMTVKLSDEHQPYMEYHREHKFIKPE